MTCRLDPTRATSTTDQATQTFLDCRTRAVCLSIACRSETVWRFNTNGEGAAFVERRPADFLEAARLDFGMVTSLLLNRQLDW